MKKKINYLLVLCLAITIFSSFVVKSSISLKPTIAKKNIRPISCTDGVIFAMGISGQPLAHTNIVPATGGATIRMDCAGTFTKTFGTGNLTVMSASQFAVTGTIGQTITVQISSSGSSRSVRFNFQ